MSEEQIQDVKEETPVTPQEAENIQKPDEAQEVQQEEPKEDSKEYNFSRLREQKEQLERQNQELRNAVEGINQSLKAKEEPEAEEPDVLASLAKDDIITVEQAQAVAQRTAQKAVKEALAAQEKQSLPERTRQKLPDFDEVLTESNIKEFEKTNPVLAAACSNANNPWQAAYEAIKMSPGYQNRNIKKQMEKDSKKIDENISKPVSSNSLGKSGALANATAYGELSKGELYSEMMSAARQV